jgi:hypothetical protein
VLSRGCAIPDRLLGGINERDWSPTLKTLLRSNKRRSSVAVSQCIELA